MVRVAGLLVAAQQHRDQHGRQHHHVLDHQQLADVPCDRADRRLSRPAGGGASAPGGTRADRRDPRVGARHNSLPADDVLTPLAALVEGEDSLLWGLARQKINYSQSPGRARSRSLQPRAPTPWQARVSHGDGQGVPEGLRLSLGGEAVAWVAAHEDVLLSCGLDTQRLSHHVWGSRRARGAVVAPAADRAAFAAMRPRRSPGGQLPRGTPGSPQCRSGTSGLARTCRRAPHKGPVLAIRSVRRRATPHASCTR
jgi:hypothetical protein